jgi:methylenetetrahydrofolate reductase (NADPH)
MRFTDLFNQSQCCLSFELFPPKTVAGEQSLMRHVAKLVSFSPSFITCTYGAGGSTRDKTLEIVLQVKQRFGLPAASHLTCVGSTTSELRHFLGLARERGVDAIVALRGDPPKGASEFQQVEGGLRYANELVEMIRAEFPELGIAVAGYPETHQEAPSAAVDLDNLKRKVDAGGEIVITQLFYDNNDFWRFRERYERAGIHAPLIPGILPVTNYSQIQRITTLCGAKLPQSFTARLMERDDPQWQFEVGVEYASSQVQDLVRAGVPGIHFYVLNKSEATAQVLSQLSPFASRTSPLSRSVRRQ